MDRPAELESAIGYDADEPRVRRAYSYDRVAWCYEKVAALYSRGAIAAAKASQITHLAPGDKVLYCGVGRGEDAILAARAGASVTAVDLSPRMLSGFRSRLERDGLKAEQICGDIRKHWAPAHYDAIAANFFLNVFAPAELGRVLSHLVSSLRPGGVLMVADFAARHESSGAKWVANANYWPVGLAAWTLRLCALHPIYDYSSHLDRLGLVRVERVRFRVFSGVPAFYESLVAVRPA